MGNNMIKEFFFRVVGRRNNLSNSTFWKMADRRSRIKILSKALEEIKEGDFKQIYLIAKDQQRLLNDINKNEL